MNRHDQHQPTRIPSDSEPIVAVASGSVDGAITIIRFSGSSSHQRVQNLIRSKRTQVQSHQMFWTQIIDPGTEEMMDDPMVVFFCGEKNYTGEESGELYIHASPYIVRRVLDSLITQGFRMAEAGEFTRRAYLNGRLDLTAAEGVASLIQAETEQQWIAAKYLASGKLKGYVTELRTHILKSMAWLEARIDFPDEKETSRVEWSEVDSILRQVQESLEKLSSTFRSGQIASKGLQVAIFGPPNAGKSTLMNHLLGHERAIVTNIAGTTRDYLEESCLLEGRMIKLIDTAGVHESTDLVEQQGIERSLEISRNADITLILLPQNISSQSLKEQKSYWQHTSSKKIIVITKTDLPVSQIHQELEGACDTILQISCHQNVGINDLKQALIKMVDQSLTAVQDNFFITHYRHKQAVDTAIRNLETYAVNRANGAYEEMLAFELQQVAQSLNGLIGEVDNENVLDVVFSSFCVGK
ncbi:MAG: tRNA uridine-5-carboxymethylaminomethyl(34) synthesis GTPase MnmE [Zetaproteobacteria bacterium]|nr:tRNA uridine-5-carboxymethylaminomethyl(34) synthesis GTPase MnmE [Zetaproteobacteria bacterium]